MERASRISPFWAAILLSLLMLHCQALTLSKSSHVSRASATFQKYRLEQIDFCKHQSRSVDACGQDCPEVLVKGNDDTGVPDIKLVVYKDNDWVAENIRKWQVWEAVGVSQMQSVIQSHPGGYVIDIGSNLGWYSLLAAAQGAPVLSVEPLSKNIMRQRSSLCRNPLFAGQVTLIPVALGEQLSDNCTLYTKETNQGNGMLDCTENLHVPEGCEVRQRHVRMAALDKLLKDIKNIAYIKMDVEGHEIFAVNGGKHTFFKRNVPFIMLEYNPSALQPKIAPDPPQAFLQQFVDAGYALSLMGFDGEELTVEQVHGFSIKEEREVYLTLRQGKRNETSSTSRRHL